MVRFGFGKKNAENDSASKGPATNPYAQTSTAADPYAREGNKYAQMGTPALTPYQQARQQTEARGASPSNRASPAVGNGYAPNPSPAMNGGGYGSNDYGNRGGYGADRYGNGGGYGGGYGADRYAQSAQAPGMGSNNSGHGGYGGLQRIDSMDPNTTEDRNALFGDAKAKYQQGNTGGNYGYGESNDDGNTGYGEDRQLTAEEQEEEDIQRTKNEIRDIKRQDVAATRNALQMAAQAEESGRATLARLGAQGERIHNTDRNLDVAGNSARDGEAKAKKLKTLNRSMFAVHVANPFTSNSRQRERDEAALEKNREQREQRADSHQAAYQQSMRMEKSFKNLEAHQKPQTKASLAERSRFQFEADSEDESMENELDQNIDHLSSAAGRLKLLARAVGEEVDAQNQHIDKIIRKSDRVDDQLAMNRARLDRIK